MKLLVAFLPISPLRYRIIILGIQAELFYAAGTVYTNLYVGIQPRNAVVMRALTTELSQNGAS